MARTGKLGTASSRLANVQLAFTSSTIHNVFASNTLTFTQTLDRNVTYNQSVANTLTFNQSLTSPQVVVRTGKLGTSFSRLSNIRLAYSSITSPTVHDLAVANALTFVQTVDRNVTYNRDADNTLALNQSLSTILALPQSIDDTLLFNQTATSQYFPNQTSQLGKFSALLGNINLSTVGKSIYYLDLAQQLNLTQQLTTPSVIYSAFNQLIFTQTATYQRVVNQATSSVLIFSQFSSYQRFINQTASNVLIFNQIIDRTVTFNLSVSNLLVFNQNTIRPIPLQNLNISIPQAQATVVNGMISIVTLSIPEQSITLPAPEFDDSDNYEGSKVIIKRSMNNVLYSWVRKNQLRKLKYTFSIGRNKSLELEGFISKAISQVITMTNWKGEIWSVSITNNPIDFSPKQVYDPERERVEVTLEFQGIKTAG